ncbi:MAG TPA: zinc finger domain-containing protein, partial [Anaerolineae bacterium]|nr:zinc finger domain-containing protein [Anaerolineae bacterium]
QVNTLLPEEHERLYHAIRQALNAGISHKGASFDSVYRGGEFQDHFQVYGRADEPCLTCGTPIVRIVLGGRSTHYCPNCQK